MSSTASVAIKYAGKRTREMFLARHGIRFWIAATTGLMRYEDADLAELRRLKPYYRGTKALAYLVILMVIPAFLIPFSVGFVGFGGFFKLLILYILAWVVITLLGIVLEVVLDAVFAIKHESRGSYGSALKTFIGYVRAKPADAVKYMAAKLIVDSVLMMVMTALYLPAMYGLVALLAYLIHAVTTGDPNVAIIMVSGFIGLIILALGAAVISMILSVPISAFYGYYTEISIKPMREAR